MQAVFNLLVTHVPIRALRHAWLRRLGVTIGDGAVVYRGTSVLGASGIHVGHRSIIGWRCVVDGRGGVTIEDDVVIASDCRIITADHDVRLPGFDVRYAPVTLENRAWLGTRAMVLKGVHVHYGAVVAAGGVATRDVPPLTIVGGVPARPIADRPAHLSYQLEGAPALS